MSMLVACKRKEMLCHTYFDEISCTLSLTTRWRSSRSSVTRPAPSPGNGLARIYSQHFQSMTMLAVIQEESFLVSGHCYGNDDVKARSETEIVFDKRALVRQTLV